MKKLKRQLHSVRYNLIPEYKGHQLGLEQAYDMYKNLVPLDWDLKLSDEDESVIDFNTKTIELSFANWTEEIILHSIGTVVLISLKDTLLDANKHLKRSKIAIELELWDWIEQSSKNWTFKSSMLRMRTLDWYRSLPENSIKAVHAFGITIK